MALATKELDEVALQGCGMRGEHDHEHIFFMHAHCHVEAQVAATLVGNVLRVVCWQCGRGVANVQVVDAEPIGISKHKCNEGRLEISYEAGSSLLKIACHQCKAVLQNMKVA